MVGLSSHSRDCTWNSQGWKCLLLALYRTKRASPWLTEVHKLMIKTWSINTRHILLRKIFLFHPSHPYFSDPKTERQGLWGWSGDQRGYQWFLVLCWPQWMTENVNSYWTEWPAQQRDPSCWKALTHCLSWGAGSLGSLSGQRGISTDETAGQTRPKLKRKEVNWL